MIAFTLITPFLFFIRNMDLILIGFKPDSIWLGSLVIKKVPLRCTKSTSSQAFFHEIFHIKRCQLTLIILKSQGQLCSHLEIFSLSFLQMDKVGQSWQVAIELLSLSKIGHIDLKKVHIKAGQTFEIFWSRQQEALSPTVLGFQDFLQHARKWYLLEGDTTSRRDH